MPTPLPLQTVVAHTGRVTVARRQQLLHQRPVTVWLTGLSGAGKSTLAYEMEQRLHDQGLSSFVLDGDNLRHNLNRDLGFTPEERQENIRRVAEVAALMNDAGLIVFTALISPCLADRAMARSIIGSARFIEVHVSTALKVCEDRDPKGLYNKARSGLIPMFTGISAPYEPPDEPHIRVDAGQCSVSEAAAQILDYLQQQSVLA
ncbi:adenylyl-sulfate kinase [Rhodoferax sp. GW822-FHT02A01]|uniref:adenylyl-sulfate kinase n=1 Tax=Rhodoferax sp. GW822-FHT02A01 TaxID=3141537 RepID=UPI00315D8821